MNVQPIVKARTHAVWLSLACAMLLAGCETPGQPPAQPLDPCLASPQSPECICKQDPGLELCACLIDPSAPDCGCLLDPGREECQPPPPCPDADAREHTTQARLLLADGQWKDGGRRVTCALEADPAYGPAREIQAQLDSEPLEYLQSRRGSQTMTYVVQTGDTLGSIAKQCLGDVDLFVALARLNNKDRPSDLVRGEQLRLVGVDRCALAREPTPTTPDTTTTIRPVDEPAAKPEDSGADNAHRRALDAEAAGELGDAYRWIEEAANAAPGDMSIADDLTRIKTTYLAQLRDRAYGYQDEGQLEKAREAWQQVLEIDPTNFEARLNLNELLSR